MFDGINDDSVIEFHILGLNNELVYFSSLTAEVKIQIGERMGWRRRTMNMIRM